MLLLKTKEWFQTLSALSKRPFFTCISPSDKSHLFPANWQIQLYNWIKKLLWNNDPEHCLKAFVRTVFHSVVVHAQGTIFDRDYWKIEFWWLKIVSKTREKKLKCLFFFCNISQCVVVGKSSFWNSKMQMRVHTLTTYPFRRRSRTIAGNLKT